MLTDLWLKVTFENIQDTLTFENILAVLSAVSIDSLLPSLGISCMIGKFDYIDKMLSVTLIPILLGLILYGIYLLVEHQNSETHLQNDNHHQQVCILPMIHHRLQRTRCR